MLTNLLLKLLDDYDTIKNILKNICMYKKKWNIKYFNYTKISEKWLKKLE